MNHETLKELVFLSYDRELSPADQAEVENHLQTCRECGDALSAWKKTAALLFASAKIESPDFFVQQVMRRLENEAPAQVSPASKLRSTLAGLKDILTPRRLVLAGTAALAISAALISQPFKSKQPASAAALEYTSDLMKGPFAYADTYADNEEADKNTAIEEYFL